MSFSSVDNGDGNTQRVVEDLNQFECINQMMLNGMQRLKSSTRAYYQSGADNERTLSMNTLSFANLLLIPRVLRDVSQVNLETLFQLQRNDEATSIKLSWPIAIAATAMQQLAHVHGESATFAAAAQTRTLAVLSTWSSMSMDRVAYQHEASGGESTYRWFQLYVYRDRQATLSLIQKAEQCGYSALVLTVDTPVLGRRLGAESIDGARLGNMNEKHAKILAEHGLGTYVNQMIDASLDWSVIEWLRLHTKLPILVKGVLHGEDARLAVKYGVNGVIVSNHGARQLDDTPATIDALPHIVQAVDGRIPVFLDGGIRHGSDAFKAIALGACAVFIGRPVLAALAIDGQRAVEHMLKLFRDQLIRCCQLCGCPSIADIRRESFVSRLDQQSTRRIESASRL